MLHDCHSYFISAGGMDFENMQDVLVLNSVTCFDIFLNVTEDSIVEDNEQFLLQLSSDDSAVTLLCNDVSITILDDDSKI